MRIKFKFLFLLPLLITATGCKSSDKITFQSGEGTFETYYNDSFFHSSNDEYNSDIALASHAMALATFNGDEDYSQRSRYLRDLWKKEGFEKISMNKSFYERPGTDTIGFGIASKKIQLLGGYFTLIAIAVRGGNYEGEWTSNVTVGTEGDCKGFSEASQQVIEGLSEFIHDYKIKGHIKIWISGYSRAAITSNLTAGNILNNLDNPDYLSNKVTFSENDIYAYCFEPPLGAYTSIENAHSSLYKGIHNFLNYNDLVPLVAPHEWGFTRYGTDHYYPDRLTDIYFDESEREKLLSYYHFMYGAEKFTRYTVDEWKFFNVGGEKATTNNLPIESVNPSLGRFARDLIHLLSNMSISPLIESRLFYSMAIEQGMRSLLEAVLGYDEDIEGINMSNIVNIIFEYTFIQNIINELSDAQPMAFADDMLPLFLQLFGANEQNIDKVQELYNGMKYFFLFFGGIFRERQDLVSQLVYRDNAMNMIIGHIPELSYAFLSSCNERIIGEDACKFNDGTYNILHIEKPKNFYLLETNISKNVFTFEDDAMFSNHLSAERFADGSIDIYLPKNGHYEYVGDVDSITLLNVNQYYEETLINENLPTASGTIN